MALEYQLDNVTVDYSYDHSNVDYMQNYNTLVAKPSISQIPRPDDSGRVEDGFGTLQPVQNTENDGHNLSVEWNINDDLTFKSITGYRTLKDTNDSGGAGANAFIPSGTTAAGEPISFARTRQNQHSQEFQLVGDMDRLECQAGLMYFHEDGSFLCWSDIGDRYTCPSGSFVGGTSACVRKSTCTR